MKILKNDSGTMGPLIDDISANITEVSRAGNRRNALINESVFNLLEAYPSVNYATQLSENSSTNAALSAVDLANVPFGSIPKGFLLGNTAIEVSNITSISLRTDKLTSIASGATWGFWIEKTTIPASVSYLKIFLYPNWLNIITADMLVGYTVADTYQTFTSSLIIDAAVGNWVHFTMFSANTNQKIYRIGYGSAQANVPFLKIFNPFLISGDYKNAIDPFKYFLNIGNDLLISQQVLSSVESSNKAAILKDNLHKNFYNQTDEAEDYSYVLDTPILTSKQFVTNDEALYPLSSLPKVLQLSYNSSTVSDLRISTAGPQSLKGLQMFWLSKADLDKIQYFILFRTAIANVTETLVAADLYATPVDLLAQTKIEFVTLTSYYSIEIVAKTSLYCCIVIRHKHPSDWTKYCKIRPIYQKIDSIKIINFSYFDNYEPTVSISPLPVYHKYKGSELRGETIFADGDSITNGGAIWRDLVADITGATVINGGIGGTTIAKRPDHQCWVNIATKQIYLNTLSTYATPPDPQNYTLEYAGMVCDSRINTIPVNVDYILSFGGANDHMPYGSVTDTPNENLQTADYVGDLAAGSTYCAAYRKMIEKMITRCPNAKIIIILPPYHLTEDNVTGVSTGYIERRNLTKQIAKNYSIPCLDLREVCGWNEVNVASFLLDNIHPNERANKVLGELIAKFVLLYK